MKTDLAENIRKYRKERGLTQERLAEALGVTPGAVYKWESGLSVPELDMLVDIADFFDTSVDSLIGYRLKDNRLDPMLERLGKLTQDGDPEALSEAEKILAKYPHSFKVVYCCASVYICYSIEDRNKERLNKALDLLAQARNLLPQNTDPRINETSIFGAESSVHYLLGETEKCVDILKEHNVGGIFNRHIATYMAIILNRPEEAAEPLADSFTEGIIDVLSSVMGYVFLYKAHRDYRSALEVASFGDRFFADIKKDNTPDYLDKCHAGLLILLSYAQKKNGMKKESEETLSKAAVTAKRFDRNPNHSLNARFIDTKYDITLYDILGATADEGVTKLLEQLGEEEMLRQWKELYTNER